MKKYTAKLSIVFFAFIIILSLCSCQQSSNDDPSTTIHSHTNASSNSNNTSTTVIETPIPRTDLPEEFTDYTVFIGKDVSVLYSDPFRIDALPKSFFQDLCSCSFLGHPGIVKYSFDKQYNIIEDFFFHPSPTIPEEERANLVPIIEAKFGKEVGIKNGFVEYYGLNDYRLALPQHFTENSDVIGLTWTPEAYNAYRDSHPKETTTTQTTTTKAKILPRIGMTKSEVEQSSWGTPSEINRTTTQYGVREQWVYRGTTKTKYIYFEDGIVTAIQD